MLLENKRKIVDILELENIIFRIGNVLIIGDGFNDLGMFDSVSISVVIKGNNFVENYIDFNVK